MTNDKQRERLVELINNYPCMSTAEDCFMESISDDLADYILANGVVVPPCKVGDVVKHDAIYYKVYRMMALSDYETPIYYDYRAEPINGEEDDDDFWFWSDRVEDGTVIVCSREEAEKALGGVQG